MFHPRLSKIKALPTILLFTVAAIWGSGFIASQIALDAHISPALFMFVRFSLAAVIVLGIFWRQLREKMKRDDLKKGFFLGLLLFLAFYVQIVGLQFTTPSNNAFLTSTNVVMVPFLWWAISKKRPEGRVFLSSLLCLCGIGILSVNLTGGISFSVGDLLTLACAFFFACQIALTGKLAIEMDTAVLVFLQFATAAVLSLLAFALTDRDFSGFTSASGMGAVLYLALFSTCLCYFLQTAVQKYVTSSKAAIILSTEALFGSLFSVLLGYDKLTVQMVLGGGIIILSLLLTELSPRRKPDMSLCPPDK
ncbi:MAG: DMT family transporter [Angelakisella sp.]